MIKFYFTLEILFSILWLSVINGFPGNVSAKRALSGNNGDLSSLVGAGRLGLSFMTGGMYNPLDPNSFMTGGVNQFVAGDGRYIPKYDPNQYSFIYAGKSNMNFGNGGCCGSDGTNDRTGGFGNSLVTVTQRAHTTESGKEPSGSLVSGMSKFGITAEKSNNQGLNTPQQSQLNTWRGEWIDSNSNNHENNKVSSKAKDSDWNGNWNKNWPGIKDQTVDENKPVQQSEKIPSWAGDWSKHFSGNKVDVKNENKNDDKSSKLPSWSGDWSKSFSDGALEKSNSGQSSNSKSTTDWNGKWSKSWPGLSESYGNIFERVKTTPKPTGSPHTVLVSNGKGTFQRTEKVLQEIINAVQKFDISK